MRLLFASPTFVRRLKGCNSIPFPFLDRLLQTIRGVNCTEQYPNYLARLDQGVAVAVAAAIFVATPRLASAAVVVALPVSYEAVAFVGYVDGRIDRT